MITILFGVPGKGKTALATQIAIKNIKNGFKVYSNYGISTDIYGIHLTSISYPVQYFKDKSFLPDSLIIVDEAQNIFNSRFFKTMDLEEIKYFSGHRHLGNDIIITTQHPNRIDVTIRDIADKFIWIKTSLPFGFKICKEYYLSDHICKSPPEIPKEFVKTRFYRIKKSTYQSYDDKYLREILETQPINLFDFFEYKKSKYIPFFKRIYINLKKIYEQRNQIKLNRKSN